MPLIDDLREQVRTSRAAMDELVRAARDGGRDMTGDELRAFESHLADAQAASSRLDDERDRELAELRAAAVRTGAIGNPARGPVLTRAQSVAEWVRVRGGQAVADETPLSFDRYLRGLATGEWDGAEHERALAEGTATAGGHLVPAPLASRVIDLARNASRVMQAGATTVPMSAQTLKLARLTGEGGPAWKAENAPVAEGDLTFAPVTFTARTMTRLVKLSVELFEDADPSAEDVIARAFAAQMATELDRAALRGAGTTTEPRGVLNTSGVTVTDHGANGAALANYDWFLDAAGAVRAGNFDPNAHIVAPRTVTSLSKLKNTAGDYLAPPAGMLPMLATNQVPANLTVGTSSDASEVYTGQWDQLMVGIRTSFRLEFLRERFLADNLQYAFLAYMRADVQLAQPAAFVVDRGVRG